MSAIQQVLLATGGAKDPPTYRSMTFSDTWSSSSLVINKPSGVVAGDILIAVVSVFTSSYTNTTPPSGWAMISGTELDCTNNDSFAAYYLIAGSSEPSTYTFTCGGTAAHVTFAFSNAVNTTPSAAVSIVESSVPVFAPFLTGVANDVTIFLQYARIQGISFDTPGGFTVIGEVNNITSGNTIHVSYNATGSASNASINIDVVSGYSIEYGGAKIRIT